VNIKDNLTELCQVEARLAALTHERDQLPHLAHPPRNRRPHHPQTQTRRELLTAAMNQLEDQGAARPSSTPTPSKTFVVGRYGNEAIETVTRVRPEAFDALIAECSYADTICALVTPDGEPVPGVTIQTRLPYLFVKLTPEAKLAAQLDIEPGGHDLNYDPAASQ
jgi:hypothetical protein